MIYGIDRTRPHPPRRCIRIEAAARRFDVSVDQLEGYAREGLLIPLQSSLGIQHYTEDDSLWISTIGHLVREARLSFHNIRQLLGQCSCWELRHCDFHNKKQCPLISDPSQPCWINRARCSVLCSYPCYGCTVYRMAPDLDAIRDLLHTHSSGTLPVDAYDGG